MEIIKKENWWVWLLLQLFTGGTSVLVLAALLNCFDKNAWYANYKNWILGALCCGFPLAIMAMVLLIQMTCQVAFKLEVSGKELYLSPYVWIVLFIVPIIGWILLLVMFFYLSIATIIKIYEGKAEKYI
ncbi:MAG: hypothetical protein RSA91_01630 [Bacilli bacterium]